MYEFQLEALWQWSDYSSVANSTKHYGSTDQLWQFDFSVSPIETWEVAAEVELFLTSRVNWTARSYALGVKKQFLDDLTGDPFALSVLGKIRYVPSQSLDQISSPYSNPMNYSLGGCFGKEWSAEGYWTFRINAYFELGLGSQGAFWNYDLIAAAFVLGKTHEFKGSLDSYIGLGEFHWDSGSPVLSGRNEVNPNNFFGWGDYHHRSSDLKITYTKHLDIWGEWGVSYTERLFAFCYPEHFRAFEIFYRFPFSLF